MSKQPTCCECLKEHKDWQEAKSTLSKAELAERSALRPGKVKAGRRICHYCQKRFCDEHMARHQCPELKRLLHNLATIQKLVTGMIIFVLAYLAFVQWYIPFRNKYGHAEGEWLSHQSIATQAVHFFFVFTPALLIGGSLLVGAILIIYYLLDRFLWGDRPWHLPPEASWSEEVEDPKSQ
jgi:hypothetical protein